jgi:hypothetical protein
VPAQVMGIALARFVLDLRDVPDALSVCRARLDASASRRNPTIITDLYSSCNPTARRTLILDGIMTP